MKASTRLIFEELIERYPALSGESANILAVYETLESVYEMGGKLLVCGNGGSAADSEHIVGELMKQFKKPRKITQSIYDALSGYGEDGERMREALEGSLPAISLTSHIALSTAYSNDKEPSLVFAQQLFGLGQEGDALICISTSGNSQNCIYAAILAKAKGIRTIAFTGKNKSRLSELCDITVYAPEHETFKIQELHLPIYHTLCAMLEEEFF